MGGSTSALGSLNFLLVSHPRSSQDVILHSAGPEGEGGPGREVGGERRIVRGARGGDGNPRGDGLNEDVVAIFARGVSEGLQGGEGLRGGNLICLERVGSAGNLED